MSNKMTEHVRRNKFCKFAVNGNGCKKSANQCSHLHPVDQQEALRALEYHEAQGLSDIVCWHFRTNKCTHPECKFIHVEVEEPDGELEEEPVQTRRTYFKARQETHQRTRQSEQVTGQTTTQQRATQQRATQQRATQQVVQHSVKRVSRPVTSKARRVLVEPDKNFTGSTTQLLSACSALFENILSFKDRGSLDNNLMQTELLNSALQALNHANLQIQVALEQTVKVVLEKPMAESAEKEETEESKNNENAEAENAEVENAEVENAEAENAEVENAEAENAEVENAEVDESNK